MVIIKQLTWIIMQHVLTVLQNVYKKCSCCWEYANLTVIL